MLCLLKNASARLGQSVRLFPSYEHASYTLLKCLHGRKYAIDIKSKKEENEGKKASARLTAKWEWVVRGNYKVAAFSAENNPANPIDHQLDRYLHSHQCPNCQTVYEHNHRYGSLHHPQHIKDCPKCKEFAPADLKIN